MDVWPGYQTAVAAVLPYARVFFDIFPVVSHANQAVDDVQRKEYRLLQHHGEQILTGLYLCDGTWRDLIEWLKAKGMKQWNGIYTLCKESGSLIASDYGIKAACQHLGHRDIRMSSAHYVDKKNRVESNLPVAPVLEVIGNGTEE